MKLPVLGENEYENNWRKEFRCSQRGRNFQKTVRIVFFSGILNCAGAF